MNTVMILFLGASIAVGASATVMGALCAGIAMLATLVLSNVILNALKKVFADCKFGATLIVVAGVTSLVTMLLHAFMPGAYAGISVYLSCLCVNLLVYANAEKDLKSALTAGVKFLIAVLIVGVVRELFGAGALAGVKVDFLAKHTINALNAPAGGFMVLAFVMALFRNKEGQACMCKDEFIKSVFANKKGEVE
ncbi:MAG: Rnf-Nqr domain containing protein [Erysipelotrichaceae bacterium]|nr:Rnf-Nqr domain containing protein [Erysipelotrichaceae bacterium]